MAGTFTLQAQELSKLESGTLESQLDYVIEKSNAYQDYKVIKKTALYKLKGNVLDSLKAVRDDLSETQLLVGKQENQINSLKADLQNVNDNLAAVNDEKNSIDFFGKQTDKSTYKNMMWGSIAALLGCLLYFIFRFMRSNAITKEANSNLATTQGEFEDFKKRAREKEQKLMRSLQDELNKRL